MPDNDFRLRRDAPSDEFRDLSDLVGSGGAYLTTGFVVMYAPLWIDRQGHRHAKDGTYAPHCSDVGYARDADPPLTMAGGPRYLLRHLWRAT
jgi:hypothetical protein